MSESEVLRLPASTVAYLHSGVVSKAVDSVFTKNCDDVSKMPFADLERYYKARASAMATKYDTVIALNGLWKTAWGDLVQEWSAKSPEDRDLDPQTVWDDLQFRPVHERAGYLLYTGVRLQPAGKDEHAELQLACSLERQDKDAELLNDGSLTGFAFVDDDIWTRMMVTRIEIPASDSGEIDVSKLSALGRHVVQLVNAVITKA